MNTRHLPSLPLLGLSLLFPLSFLQADEVKLKSGESFTGRITYEADDIIKIEVPVSASIKETKIIGRADIAEILKDAPDDVEFNRIQSLVPTGSLMPASAYRQVLETGPDAFLKAYPQSAHIPKVEEIRKTLAEELDKVERGFLKIEEEWLSPQDKIDYKDLIDSRVRFLSMTNLAAAENLNGYIGALREFETIERHYYGSPVFPRAVELAREILPNLGRQIQTMLRNVDFRNAEYEQSLANSAPDARERLTQAREREEKSYQDSLAADKQAGLKWVQLNPRIKASIEGYLTLASSELARINAFDVAALTQQAEKLVEADKLIAQGDLEKARTLITEAAAMTGQKASSKRKSKSKNKSKSKSKSKGGSRPGSYIAALNAKVNDRLADEKAKADARKAAAESEALTAALNKTTSSAAESENGTSEDKASEDEVPADAEAAAPTEAQPDTPKMDDFAALASSGKSRAKADEDPEPSSRKKGKSKSRDKSENDEEKPKSRPVVDEGGGFPTHLIIPILTVLLIVTVVLLKVFGIGGKKSDD